MTVSVLLQGDHVDFRKGVRAWLETSRNLRVVGETSNRFETLSLVEILSPDVVVMDCIKPDQSMLDTILAVQSLKADTRMVILALHHEKAYVLNTIQSGASAYLLKEDVIPHLEKAISAVAAGEYYFSPFLRAWAAQSGLGNFAANRRMDF
jgi:DNA-binding NarL/FixJ family response regulator